MRLRCGKVRDTSAQVISHNVYYVKLLRAIKKALQNASFPHLIFSFFREWHFL